jgi:hypothetical protein
MDHKDDNCDFLKLSDDKEVTKLLQGGKGFIL